MDKGEALMYYAALEKACCERRMPRISFSLPPRRICPDCGGRIKGRWVRIGPILWGLRGHYWACSCGFEFVRRSWIQENILI